MRKPTARGSALFCGPSPRNPHVGLCRHRAPRNRPPGMLAGDSGQRRTANRSSSSCQLSTRVSHCAVAQIRFCIFDELAMLPLQLARVSHGVPSGIESGLRCLDRVDDRRKDRRPLRIAKLASTLIGRPVRLRGVSFVPSSRISWPVIRTSPAATQ